MIVGTMWSIAIRLAERAPLPDPVLRAGIRALISQRLSQIAADDPERAAQQEADFLAHMARAPVAPKPDKANEQHYELPPSFFAQVLGPNKKYSCCYWDQNTPDLATAEANALARTCDHAQLEDGQTILDLGCGWGALSFWIATRYPRTRILAVSNSRAQTEWIREEAQRRNLHNLHVQTADMNDFDAGDSFDRIVSVEMFEHLRNWPAVFGKVARWLKPTGRFLLHVFVHRSVPYEYIPSGPADWMSQYFFTGGMMPSDSLALCCQENLRALQRWRWCGTHYQRTCEAWHDNLQARRQQVRPILESVYGSEASIWEKRWKLFFLACAELFGFRQGREWWVSHYLFAPRHGG
jgi:cyclopropane-fatty-acyl-phospholipid synthase